MNSSLEIPFFNNWFAYNQVEEFTVSMWINPAVGSNAVDLQGVLSNGNCEALSSVKIVIRSGMLYLGLDTDVSVETQGVPVSSHTRQGVLHVTTENTRRENIPWSVLPSIMLLVNSLNLAFEI